MKIIHLSDTHGKHRQLSGLPDADVIVHTGDFCDEGTIEEAEDFIHWFCDLPIEHKIFIAGNHDDCLCEANIEGLPENVHYLCNDSVNINGIKFYGVPMFLQDDLDGNFPKLYNQIPYDTDVLLTHQPPFSILDESDGINFGDRDLYKRVMEIMPIFHLFGHIHSSKETYRVFRRIWFSNAACQSSGHFNVLTMIKEP